MAKREMIVTGYTGVQPEEQVDPFLRHLIGLFVDELREAEKLLFEYSGAAGLPDLYIAVYDTETFTLTSLEGIESRGVSVSFGRRPDSPFRWQQLRYAFNAAVSLAIEIE
jgi:hypothetical protein